MDAQRPQVDERLERQVLGQVLQYGLVNEFVDAGLTVDHFAKDAHHFAWLACVAVVEAGATPDIVTVARQLRASDQMSRVDEVYFSRLIDDVVRPSVWNIINAVTELDGLLVGRTVYYSTVKLLETLRERPQATADGLIATHADEVQRALEHQRGQGAAWLDVNAQLTAHERDVRAAESGLRVGLGLEGLDSVIGGIRAGEVLGLLGRPGIGKTVFLSHIARAACDVGFGQVFFSLEMPASQIVGRLKQILYRVGRHQLEQMVKGQITDDGLYRRTFDRFVLVDTPSLAVAEMSRRVRQIQHGPLRDIPIGLIIIDHLGLIGGDRKLQTYDRVSVQAREIKELAKRLNCAVVLAVQVNREAGGDGSRELGLGSARDSGVVEEAMDYMVGIRRIDRSLSLSQEERTKYRDVILSKVIKNRHGDPGTNEIAYRFYPQGLRLEEDKTLTNESQEVMEKIIAATGRGGRR